MATRKVVPVTIPNIMFYKIEPARRLTVMFHTKYSTDVEYTLDEILGRAKATACVEGRRAENDQGKEITDPKGDQQHLLSWISDLKLFTEAGQ